MDNQSKQEMITQGLKQIRILNKEFLENGEGSLAVRNWLSKTCDDDALMTRFLVGRKYRPKHAWETLKRNAEVRFDQYPESFQSELPKPALLLRDNYIFGVLKARDSQGRRITYFNASRWDPELYSMDILTQVAVHAAERLIRDDDCMNNGVVFIQECSAMGLKHTKEYSLHNMLRLLNIFWYAFPLKLKGLYYVNVPYVLTVIYGIIKPFLPKKIKERFLMTSSSKKFEALHEIIPADVLPKCLGGKLEYEEAVDFDFLNF